MAFNILNYNCSRHSASSSSTGNNNTQDFYTSTDTLATIFTSGYFPAFFGFAPNLCPQNNDLIAITASDGVSLAQITDKTTGAIVSVTFGSNTTTFPTQSVTFSGPWASPQAVTLQYVRTVYPTGYTETRLIIPFINTAATSGAAALMNVAPTYYPLWMGSAIQVLPIYILDNGVEKAGQMFIDNSVLQIQPQNNGTFTGSGPTGWSFLSVTYPSN